jgi:tRNA (mo5U34)-methyltransferase
MDTASQFADLRARADSLAWFHSIDLGSGVVTHGLSDSTQTLTPDQLPAFTGRTVLDIGAWDGYYSFLAERSGATRVVALDHYVWGVDIAAREQYWNECRARGELPDQTRDLTDFWRPDLPGRRGFELAKDALNSSVEPMLADFATVDIDSIGTFDVVLYLGVLYHMKEPLQCLERVRAVTREVAVIETAAISIPSAAGVPLVRFLAGSELNRDFGNWFQPNVEALEALAIAAGFTKTEVIQGPLLTGADQARRRSRREPTPDSGCFDYRAIIHAYV